MKKLLITFIYFIGFISVAFATMIGRVDDQAGVFSTQEITQINNLCQTIETDYAPIQVCVATVPKIKNTISDDAVNYARSKGVGDKKTSKGLVIYLAPKQREIFIATGYGMEAIMPDIVCNKFFQNAKPFLSKKQWFKGVESLLNQSIERFKLSPEELKSEKEKISKQEFWIAIIVSILILTFIISISIGMSTNNYASTSLSNSLSKSWSDHDSFGGGGFGGGGFGGKF